MSHKVHPRGYRLGINENWSSRWFDSKEYSQRLREDISIRNYLTKKMRSAGLERVEIERTAGNISVIIHTSRPGIVIGRSGTGIEIFKKDLLKTLQKISVHGGGQTKGRSPELRIEVREVRNPESFASLVAMNVAEQLERRMPFRQVLKRTIDRTMVNKEVQGARISISGRLGGADMARKESVKEGSLPRNTIRADIDFSLQEAYTTYGVIGVKVWIYKGQKLDT